MSIVNPKPSLNDLTGKDVIVKLKCGMENEGMLLSVDSYMNVQLGDAKEYIDGQLAGALVAQIETTPVPEGITRGVRDAVEKALRKLEEEQASAPTVPPTVPPKPKSE